MVPFLISSIAIERPILGFNVLEEVVQGRPAEFVPALITLLSDSISASVDQVELLVNYIQTNRPSKCPRQAALGKRPQKNKRQTLYTTPECADPPEEDDSNSDSDCDGPRYWLGIPAERIPEVPSVVPPQRPAITFSHPVPVPVREEVRVNVDLPEMDPTPERELEREHEQDEVQPVEGGPEEQNAYDQAPEPILDEQPLVNAMPDCPTEVRRSSRDRST
ncbi:hypothetical protein PAMP_022883 [Pampus punctatissimus]